MKLQVKKAKAPSKTLYHFHLQKKQLLKKQLLFVSIEALS